MSALLFLLLALVRPTLAQDPPPLPAATETGQLLQDTTLIDYDYGFKLTLPKGWTLVDQKRSRELLASAVAGALSGDGRGGFVVVGEPVGTLEENARIVVESQPGLTREVLSQERMELNGVPAIRSVLALDRQGVKLSQQHLSVLWDGKFYQVLCTGPPSSEGDRCEEFVRGFSLLGTRVRERQQLEIEDVATRSWRVQDGVFESAVSGLTLRPPPGWRLLVGDELRSLNAACDVGITRAAPDAWVLFNTETILGGELDEVTRIGRTGILEAAGPEAPTAPLTLRVGDREVPSLRVTGQASPSYTWWHGVVQEDSLFVQITAFTSTGSALEVEPELPGLLEGFSLLDEPARAALERELAEGPIPAEVGLDWSLRDGRWTGYSQGLSWTPPDGIWEASAGRLAEDAYEGAVLRVANPRTGSETVLIPLGDLGRGRKAHMAARAEIPRSYGEFERVQVAGRRGYTSLALSTGDIPMMWRLTTFELPDHGTFALLSYALLANWESTEAAIVQAEQALSDTRALEPRRVEEGLFESQRLGVALALPEDMPCQDPIQDYLRAQADGISCQSGTRAVLLIAIKNSSVGVGDSQGMHATIMQMLGSGLAAPGAQVEEGPDTLGGLASLRLRLVSKGIRTSAEVVNRDHILVMLMLVGMSPEEQERWRAGLEFLD